MLTGEGYHCPEHNLLNLLIILDVDRDELCIFITQEKNQIIPSESSKTSTTRGSKKVPDEALIYSSAFSSVQAGLYGRLDLNASYTSTTAKIRATNGI
jgi:hypothetical protein